MVKIHRINVIKWVFDQVIVVRCVSQNVLYQLVDDHVLISTVFGI